MSANFDPMGATIPRKTTTQPTNGGYTGTVGPAAAPDLLTDPHLAYVAYRAKQGKTGRNKSERAGLKESLFGRALASILNLETTENPGVSLDNINELIGRFSESVGSGNFYRDAASVGTNAANRIDFANLDNADAEKNLRMIGGLAGLGQSSVGASGIQSRLDDLLDQKDLTNLETDYDDEMGLGGRFKGSPFWEALAALGLR